jgi:hypothetical protein
MAFTLKLQLRKNVPLQYKGQKQKGDKRRDIEYRIKQTTHQRISYLCPRLVVSFKLRISWKKDFFFFPKKKENLIKL